MATEIKIIPTNSLHCHYHGQTQPQGCFVELDCESGELCARYNGEIGNAVSMHVWHNRTLRWALPFAMREDRADELLTEIEPLAAEIVAGYSCEWNGSDHVGALDCDAEEANEAIGAIIDALDPVDDCLTVWDCADWLAGIGNRSLQAATLGITANTTDVELVAISARLEAEAAADDVDVLEGVERCLTGLRDAAREEVR